jgi:hypothetical protein
MDEAFVVIEASRLSYMILGFGVIHYSLGTPVRQLFTENGVQESKRKSLSFMSKILALTV